jgi:hypothetical protein
MNLFNRKPKIYCEFARLTFKKELIDVLKPNDLFEIYVKNDNETFRMSKKEFYNYFPNVVNSSSYNDIGNYNYKQTPQKAYKFLKK